MASMINAVEEILQQLIGSISHYSQYGLGPV